MSKISIIGCGWLGFSLGEALVQSGYEVIGSTTTEDKLQKLTDAGIQPVLFRLEPMPMGKDFNQLFDADLLIVNIPPGRKTNPPHYYEEQIKYLKYQLKHAGIRRVIFISSTSYYPNTNDVVTTDTAFDYEAGSSEAVVKGEQQITQIEQDLVILRCGGLMGGDRIPGRWFSGKETKGADTLVNYIHRDDVIKVIQEFIKKWPEAKRTMNLVSDDHPTRKEVHETMARQYGFEPPVWIAPEKVASKVVESDFKNWNLKSPLAY